MFIFNEAPIMDDGIDPVFVTVLTVIALSITVVATVAIRKKRAALSTTAKEIDLEPKFEASELEDATDKNKEL